MPYKKSRNLPSQRSSYISHLDTIKNEPIIKEALELLKVKSKEINSNEVVWESNSNEGTHKDFKAIYCVDGSMQIIKDEEFPFKEIGFVKIALVRIDKIKLDKLDVDFPHPMQIKNIIEDSSFSSSSVFPLKNVGFEGLSISETIRELIFKFITNKKYSGELLETLKWLIFKKWLPESEHLKQSEKFKCPYCNSDDVTAYIPYNSEYGYCNCKESQNKKIYITDWFGFHGDMVEEYASDKVVNAYMNVMENLILMATIRRLWESRNVYNNAIEDVLFVKDGPLGLSSRYAKVNVYIRNFLNYAYNQNINIHIMGQEKSGIFVDYFESIKGEIKPNTFFIPSSDYIKKKIKCQNTKGPYGRTTNYGWKVFYNSKENRRYVLNIPVICNDPQNKYFHNTNPSKNDVIGLFRILDAVNYLVSRKFDNALYPIELAHSIASLSTYPSAKILKVFSDDSIGE